MKKLTGVLLAHLFLSSLNAQYCGNNAAPPFGHPSGPTECNPSGMLTKTGLMPSDSLFPLTIGGITTAVIQFKTYDSMYTDMGQPFSLLSLRFDSIGNLPAGLCWTTNKINNQFSKNESGCIKLTGLYCAPLGQYMLRILVSPDFGFPLQDPWPYLTFYLRVKNPGDADIPVDTSQRFSNPFIPYDSPPNCTDIDDINTLTKTVYAVSISPNPLTDKASITFFSKKNLSAKTRITNLLGTEVYHKEIETTQGENKTEIERKNLSAGVYFYSITDGITKVTKRIVIAE